MTKVTPEIVKNILELYSQGKTQKEIAAALNIGHGTVSNYLIQNGKRTYNKRTPLNNKTVKTGLRCPQCGTLIVKGARFCYMCGKDVRTEQDLITERLSKLLSLSAFIPAERVDEYIKSINTAIDYINKGADRNGKRH